MTKHSEPHSLSGEFEGTSLGDTIYRKLVENASDGIAIIQDTIIKYANPALTTMLGYTWDEVLGTSYTQYLPPESLEQVASYYQSIARQSVPEIYETTVCHKSGRHIPVEINTSLITIGRRAADFVIFRSLKERHTRLRMAERIQQSQKLESLGVLAGGISHDFNNLLQGILGNADLALMYESDIELVRVCLKDIKQAADKASELAFQMLAYSGKGAFDARETDVNQLITEAAELLDLALPKNARLHLLLDPSLPKLRLDQAQFSQVILNLLNNAMEAIGERGGDISISTTLKHCDRKLLGDTYLDEQLKEGLYFCLTILDNGTGIEESVRNRIFDPFFSTKFTGRGLGLAAVLGIVRAHNGAISVQSKYGEGTSFNVYIPAGITESAKWRPPSSLPTLPNRGNGTVLLVDDESTVRVTTTRILERFGYSVIEAANGETALALYNRIEQHVDIVLLDMMMPHMDGKETFDKLITRYPNTRVILMSGYQESEVRQQFGETVPSGFLQKPFTAKKLLGLVRQLMES